MTRSPPSGLVCLHCILECLRPPLHWKSREKPFAHTSAIASPNALRLDGTGIM